MASDITFRVVAPDTPGPDCPDEMRRATRAAQRAVETLASDCTRFDPASDLMRANRAATEWATVSRVCFNVLAEAHGAYERSDRLFDPRIMTTLLAYGYDRSLPFGAADWDVAVDGGTRCSAAVRPLPSESQERTVRSAWRPLFDRPSSRVQIGPIPVDLGGIGKGVAVRSASEELARASANFMVDAGGDCYLAGTGPEGDGWRVAVEDPILGPAGGPIAVLNVIDAACATSSIRLRTWRTNGRKVHHLIDPRTGAPGGEGLLSVTVISDDPAMAEVLTKVLFLQGRSGISAVADELDVAAMWIDVDGVTWSSPAMRPFVLWVR